MESMGPELLTKARAGDSAAFRQLTEPYRRELHVHCYRMLGSFQDAEDTLQDTLLRAWQGLSTFESRASIRTWLYRIATNTCLNALRANSRRTAKEWDMAEVVLPKPSKFGEVVWLEPYPDPLSEPENATPLGPEAHYEQTEAMSLAFITALQLLPARQRAVLILREVLGYHAVEVASMLDTSVDSVNSALKRARATLKKRSSLTHEGEPAPEANSAAERSLASKFVRAYEAGDLAALLALLTEDVAVTMPPIPLEYHGRDAVRQFYATIMGSGPVYELVPAQTRANGQLAFGTYYRARRGRIRHGAGLLVITLAASQISALTRFESSTLPWFGLPRSLPGRGR
jgi:RNA polymerase sigma-70 factor (TIGR02960 family)